MEARKLPVNEPIEEYDVLKNAKTFCSFSVKNIQEAKKFYGDTLGLDIHEDEMGALKLSFTDGKEVFIYPKQDHIPATFTVLNFKVPHIEDAVRKLKEAGIEFEQYGGKLQTDFAGIHKDRDHAVAWFKDPDGNLLSVIQWNPSDSADIGSEFHRGGGLEGYGHKITTSEKQSDRIKDLE